jgi:hypothetical protein
LRAINNVRVLYSQFSKNLKVLKIIFLFISYHKLTGLLSLFF